MRYKIVCLYLLLLFIVGKSLVAQDHVKIAPKILNQKWDASWITHPHASLKDYSVLHFRKTFELAKKEKEFIVHVSADNRYRFYVNGTEVGRGPARGDLNNWHFESMDVSAFLVAGTNIFAAVVWNFGDYMPLAQMSHKTAFIIQGNSAVEAVVNTDQSWKVIRNDAYVAPVAHPGFTSVGPNDQLIGKLYPYGWEKKIYHDQDWLKPKLLEHGVPYGKASGWQWMLVPRQIPMMEYKKDRLAKVARINGKITSSGFLQGSDPIKIPPHQKISIMLDQGYLTAAYPELLVSKGKGAKIHIAYAEALVDVNGQKGNRNETQGKVMPVYLTDRFEPDGGEHRYFQPLWFRTYRYVELTIESADEEVILEDFYGYFTAYPFEEKGNFKSNDQALKKIWDVGWRTARLCAGETYFDCPYYEQLQYIGDTRIQGLISLYVAGDERLLKNAITQFQQSLQSNGLTQSRYPSSEFQIIPPFSLIWVNMVHDYWKHVPDAQFVEEQLQTVGSVLNWYDSKINAQGILGPMEWWNFVDWAFEPWQPERPIGGTPPGAIDGNSSVITLQYIYALQLAADLFEASGKTVQSISYRNRAAEIKGKLYQLCWDGSRNLLADTPEKKQFSQHANALAVLTDMFSEHDAKLVVQKLLSDVALSKATFYFKFYVFQAMKKAGLSDDYLPQLKPWHEMISIGLSTFAETPEPSRSDCHAWSAHPLYDFLATVCGIVPASEGYKTVSIAPALGALKEVEGTAMHPLGKIHVQLKRFGKQGIRGIVELPVGLSGSFKWAGKLLVLNEGRQVININ